MTQFSNKFKKTLFLAHLPHFGGKNFFSKYLTVMHNNTWASNAMLTFRKN